MPSKITGHRKTPFRRTLLAAGVAAALGTSASLAFSAEIEEIVVTARQRSESSQDIPMMIQSLTGEDLEKQGITTLEDFSRFVAGLNIHTSTPGQNTIVFRCKRPMVYVVVNFCNRVMLDVGKEREDCAIW